MFTDEEICFSCEDGWTPLDRTDNVKWGVSLETKTELGSFDNEEPELVRSDMEGEESLFIILMSITVLVYGDITELGKELRVVKSSPEDWSEIGDDD